MTMPWWIIIVLYVGYCGFSVAVATGTIFDDLRTWLKSFAHPLNPFRFLGHLLSCSMCIGFWVGAIGDPIHGFVGGPWWIELSIRVASGGIVSLVSYVIDLVVKRGELAVADKETEHEYIQQSIRRAEHEPASPEGADLAPGGGSEPPGGEGDRGGRGRGPLHPPQQ